jgi:hypothetical protein
MMLMVTLIFDSATSLSCWLVVEGKRGKEAEENQEGRRGAQNGNALGLIGR